MRFSETQRAEKKKIFIKEINRISKLLNKRNLNMSDFVRNVNIPEPVHRYVTLFGTFGGFKKEAGLVPPQKGNYFIRKKLELRGLFKEIALKNGNKLSMPILMDATHKSYTGVMNILVPYFGGICKLCKLINCELDSGFTGFNIHSGRKDTTQEKKKRFEISILGIAKKHNNSLSEKIVFSESALSPPSLMGYSSTYFGGFRNMCKELGIVWVRGNRGIDITELEILQDIKLIYNKNSFKISRAVYNKKGKYKMELVEGYFGSFGKACAEININTEAMAEVKR